MQQVVARLFMTNVKHHSKNLSTFFINNIFID